MLKGLRGDKMKIDIAADSDYGYLHEHDRHISQSLLLQKMKNQEIYILRNEDESIIGWMRYGYFWDNTPFMNMIWISEPFRGKGLGTQAVLFWENEMQRKGFALVMTSTLSNERAQHFYRKLGYRDAGCLLLENEPLEIIMTKKML
jgi:ribosomal protein S18 acetylase RimI-like enzyme